MLPFGAAILLLWGTSEADRRDILPIRSRMLWLLLPLLALLASSLSFHLLLLELGGTPGLKPDPKLVRSLVTGSALGTAWIVRTIALTVMSVAGYLTVRSSSNALLAVLVLTGGVALATLSWSGHAAASEPPLGTLHRFGNSMHLWAAGAWVGSLALFVAFIHAIRRPSTAEVAILQRMLSRFSAAGTLIVLLLVVTGIGNSAMIIGRGGLPAIIDTPYGRLLALKLLAFALMLGLAAYHRWRLTGRLTPADGGVASSVAKLKYSMTAEVALGIFILILVGWLGTLDPMLQ